MVLNAAARLVVGTGKFSHVTPILHDVLHWLPCTAPNQLQNHHTGSGLYSRHRPGLFRWRLHLGDCSPRTNQPAFSDAWRSSDPSNTHKIGQTKFPYIRTDGVELAPVFTKTYSAISRDHFRKELKTYLFKKAYRTSLWELLKSELT